MYTACRKEIHPGQAGSSAALQAGRCLRPQHTALSLSPDTYFSLQAESERPEGRDGEGERAPQPQSSGRGPLSKTPQPRRSPSAEDSQHTATGSDEEEEEEGDSQAQSVSADKPGSSDGSSGELWACSFCTLENDPVAHSSECAICG